MLFVFSLGVSQRKDLTLHDESTCATEINFNDTQGIGEGSILAGHEQIFRAKYQRITKETTTVQQNEQKKK